MKKCEIIACGQFLTEYPHNLEFNEIMDLLIDDHESILVWEPFETYPLEDVASFITELMKCLLSQYGE